MGALTLNHKSILRYASFTTLMGWAIIHIYWEGPYRTFFWSEEHFKFFVENYGNINWSEYVSSPNVDKNLTLFSRIIGYFLAATGILSLFNPRILHRYGSPLVVSSLILFFVAYLGFIDSGYRVGMLIEYASQFAIPALTFFYFRGYLDDGRLLFYLRLLVFMTFLGHGLFAIGYYPIPGKFTDMVIQIMSVDEATAHHLLRMAGFIDLALCLVIWIPELGAFAAAYCVFWGFVTALARPLTYILLDVPSFEGYLHWGAQALYRGPHFLIPLAILIIMRDKKIIQRF